MKDYASMSDQQINQGVADVMGGVSDICVLNNGSVIIQRAGQICGMDKPYEIFDPCNNQEDAWPIIVGKQISLISRCANGEWKAQLHLGRDDIFDSYASCWDKNPLRAAMIVFLMMKESEK